MVAVREVLDELGIREKPSLLVFNKIDQLNGSVLLNHLKEDFPESVAISALEGDGLEGLKDTVNAFIDRFHIKSVNKEKHQPD